MAQNWPLHTHKKHQGCDKTLNYSNNRIWCVDDRQTFACKSCSFNIMVGSLFILHTGQIYKYLTLCFNSINSVINIIFVYYCILLVWCHFIIPSKHCLQGTGYTCIHRSHQGGWLVSWSESYSLWSSLFPESWRLAVALSLHNWLQM